MLLMMQMGLRIGEVCGLQWGDFDLQDGVLSVRRTVKRIYMAPGKTTLVTQSPKTQSSERDIPIPTGILSLLKKKNMSGRVTASGFYQIPTLDQLNRAAITRACKDT